MYCENCGNKLSDQDLFCAECGCKVRNLTSSDTKSSKTLWVILGCMFLGFLLIIGLIIFMFVIIFGSNVLDEEGNYNNQYDIDNVKIENFEKI